MRPIASSLSPNAEKKDVVLALKLLFSPFAYQKGKFIAKLEGWFTQYFDREKAISFRSGRDSLYALLKAFQIGVHDEVIVQAFTCVAVANAVVWSGAKPVYVDIDENYGINPKNLKSKITSKTKAIVVQHTFGIPSNLSEICDIARKKGVVIIEDCAHVIGGEYKNEKLGTWGDAAFFSFGRDKAFSSVFGGMAIAKDSRIVARLLDMQKSAPYPSNFWVFQQLFHPVAFFFILPLYNVFGIGKALLVAFQKIHLLSFPVSLEDKRARAVPPLFEKMPNALCELAYFQLEKINEFNQKRKQHAKEYHRHFPAFEYQEGVSYLRFPILVENKQVLLKLAKKKNILLGNWYGNVIDPKGVDFEAIFYRMGSCPIAEERAKKIVNLPTYPTMTVKQREKVIQLIKFYENSTRSST